ncbi:MAG: hypothetical protein LBK47_10365, partial [Prevotellaceae bacterium]|nr:hypothetical protein [Prevotellaceae bacterium]
CLLNAANTPLQDLDLGLVGAAGVGLKLMLESNAGAPGKGVGMAATFPKITACCFSQHSHFNA